MPRIEDRRLLCLTAEQIAALVKTTKRQVKRLQLRNRIEYQLGVGRKCATHNQQDSMYS
jgi:hypothetical protein